MDTELTEYQSPRPASMPLDLRTTLIGLLRRSPILLLFIAASIYAVLKFTPMLSKKTFQAETLLRYDQRSELKSDTDEKTLVVTFKDTVKVESNLEEARRRLGLKETTREIEKDCDADVEKNTTLLTITARWKTPHGASDLANTLRDVFLESYRNNAKAIIMREVDDLQRRLEVVRAQLKASDATLQQFTSQNKVTDIDKQSRALLEEENSMSVLLEQAQAERRTVEEQSDRLDQVIADLKAKVAREQTQNSELENLSDINIRIGKIREAIQDDRQNRTSEAELNERLVEMNRAKSLRDMGALSEQDYGKAVTAYQKAQIAAVDTDQIKQWKADLAELQKKVIPNQGVSAPSAPILQSMLVRTFEVQLQRLAVQEKVKSLQRAKDRVQAQLEQMPILQRQFDALNRNVTSAETERIGIESRIAAARRAYEAQTPDFTIISVAKPEPEPSASTGKMIGAGILLGGLLLGLITVVGLELLDRTIRSGAEVPIRLQQPLLSALPARRRRSLFPQADEAALAERLTLLSQRVRQGLPQHGAMLLVTSAGPDEGAGFVAANLAACYGRQGEKVLLIDALNAGSEQQRLHELIPASTQGADLAVSLPASLTAYLSREVESAGDLILPTASTGVSVLSRHGVPLSPDLLGSTQMCRLYAELSKQFDMILTVASSASESIEAQLLAQHVESVVMVVQSRRYRASSIRHAITRLITAGQPIAGVVLTGVSRIYQSKDR